MAPKKQPVYNEQYADLRYIEPVQPLKRWPTRLLPMTRNLKALDKIKYEDYCVKERKERLGKPWRKHLIKVANKIVVNAKHYERTRNTNEAEWRALDADIFGHYKDAIHCRDCRRRIWRSEIEVSVADENPFATKIRDDQKSRRSCKCAIKRPDKEWIEHSGINQELHSRIEIFVQDEFGVRRRPDRIHGVRLPLERETIPAIYDINAHPYTKKARGTPLFPYLVHEAKAHMRSKDLPNLEHQMKLPIRALLRAQENLRDFNGTQSTWYEGPLVWVVTNWGYNWQISAAYIDETIEKEKRYVVNHVWSGNVMKKDRALQLLLVLDYILDWATEIYRPTILNELRLFEGRHIPPAIETGPRKRAIKSRKEQVEGYKSTKPQRRTASEVATLQIKLPRESGFSQELDLVTMNMPKDLVKRFNEMSVAEFKQGLEVVTHAIGGSLSGHDLPELKKSIGLTTSNLSSKTVPSDVVAPTSTYKKTYNLRSRTIEVPDNMASVSANVASQTSNTGSPIFSDTKDDTSPVKLEVEPGRS